MSVSVAFQDVILRLLKESAAVQAIVGDRIYDGVPDDAVFPYISFGPSDYNPDDADCIDGREEAIQLDCWSRDDGLKWPCKQLVDAVKSALHDHDDELTSGALVQMRVTLARVLDDPDRITAHGVVQVTATIEE
ncbi:MULTISPECIES: DUF3168 domain-containing protein [unclassified Rhizobium]|uniref:DUF3168 domain-containing protein n=1 Tax=unclassified Rhizobium TaxID=2613769 RepID=UPI001AE432B8|nr:MULTISPECIES: DUF3168 domain-containing protein [unclassified Rhizobium]MBP2459590.1 hypothetical protein [Rhizobium sp. PvP014]MBP2531884.1 hypothetical protein [Rhizobium sp. PvP099]